MALTTYRKKRHFEHTPEPGGGKRTRSRTAALRFVVQKHAARSLHYDFRLEWDGVLKSWAVPKGPSPEPGTRRLAVEVEDHPLEYGGFEGQIPKGNYGAGTVEIWDAGTWEPEGDPRTGLRDGSLHFRLHGRRLHGRWNLVRMDRRESGRTDKPQWLLIKSRDDSAEAAARVKPRGRQPAVARGDSPERSNARRPHATARSARPGGARPRETSPRGAPAPRRGTPPPRRGTPPPRFLDPQLATPVEVVPEGDEWIHEIKFDGYRLQARIEDRRVTLRTRRGLDWSERFPAVVEALANLPVDSAILDGEVTVSDDEGITRFQLLQHALGNGGSEDLAYNLFDLLWLDGRDLTGEALATRKEALAGLLSGVKDPMLRYSDHVVGHGGRFHRAACQRGLEGIVSKRRDTPYRGGRGRDWVKGKCRPRQELVIAGWTDPQGTREAFGSLLLGVHRNGQLEYAGRVGTGFGGPQLKTLLAKLDRLARSDSPLAGAPRMRDAHWVEPKLVAEVSFAEWTNDGRLRQASFVGLREDKRPEEIGVETPAVARARSAPRGRRKAGASTDDAAEAAPRARHRTRAARRATPAASTPKMSATARRAAAGDAVVAGVTITHPDRVLYGPEGITKLDLARYVESVADRMLPHVTGRPLMVLRCPGGVGSPCFIQKRPLGGATRAAGAEDLVIHDLAGLVELVQNGAIEIHSWGAPRARLAEPDRLVFDLDPHEAVSWPRVIAVARELQDRLAARKLPAFLKTTGGRGLHVITPLVRGATWQAVRDLADTIAAELADGASDLTLQMAKSRRTGKIFLDTLRNVRGATCVAPWSPRARAGATISQPLDWDDLSPRVPPARFTVRAWSAAKRMPPDPWAEWEESRVPLPAAGKRTTARRTSRPAR